MSTRKARLLRRLDDRTMPMNVFAINRGMFELAVNTPLDDAMKHLPEDDTGIYRGIDFSERGVEASKP